MIAGVKVKYNAWPLIKHHNEFPMPKNAIKLWPRVMFKAIAA